MGHKAAIVVHGRFWLFDVARELIKQGLDLTLLTNYPKSITRKFGIPNTNVSNCLSHGVLSRLFNYIPTTVARSMSEPFLHRWFSRWAAHRLASMDVNAIHSLSGVSEEVLVTLSGHRCLKTIVRGSSHIRTQDKLLREEEVRSGGPVDRPSAWMIEREEREYRLADIIVVLSSFAHQSFLDHGVSADKLRILPLGSELKRFRASIERHEERCARILNGAPLQVLTVGSFSFRKGALDLVNIAARLKDRMKFRFVGDVPGECKNLRSRYADVIEFIPRQPQFSLPPVYEQCDLFVFPSIEDGYAVVLAQAQAGGLPILATTNSSAPDIVKDNESGWILPIRNPAAFVERLEWCDAHREQLVNIVRDTYANFRMRDWHHVASDLISIFEEQLAF
jgi:glycosyltransferase involved in cell wall biosynthesis